MASEFAGGDIGGSGEFSCCILFGQVRDWRVGSFVVFSGFDAMPDGNLMASHSAALSCYLSMI